MERVCKVLAVGRECVVYLWCCVRVYWWELCIGGDEYVGGRLRSHPHTPTTTSKGGYNREGGGGKMKVWEQAGERGL